MVQPSTLARVLAPLEVLKPIAARVLGGEIKVEERTLDENIQALYVPTAGSFKPEPELQDTIVLNARYPWNLDESLYDRSVLVHEAFHAADDLTGQPSSYLASEARAWTGQFAYVASQIEATGPALRSQAIAGYVQELKTHNLDELTFAAAALALRAAHLPGPSAPLLEKALRLEIRSLTGLDPLFEKAPESLQGVLGLIYLSGPATEIPFNGIGKAQAD